MQSGNRFKSNLLFATAVGLLATNAYAEQIDNKLKDGLLKGYMSTCVPTIQNQLPGLTSSKAIAYCACVGGKTFQNFTKKQYAYLTKYAKLPPEIESQRIAWRSQCNSQLD
jgi:hypothetical protein